jgi:protocatechuate 3,4-dioxygenase beta subunit
MRRNLLCTIAAILALAATLVAREAVGNLAGTLLDSHGNPVAGATVFIQTSDGQHPHATHTDAEGHFLFERYSVGQYDVRASIYSVFTDWNRRVLIHANRTTHITLRLPGAIK